MTLEEACGAGAQGTPALSFEQVVFRYSPGSPPVLNGFDLALFQGEWVALVGPNGAGKSTVVRLANGLLRPCGGRVLVDGIDLAQAAELWRLRAKVGVVLQDPGRQLIGATVEEDIAFGLENLGMDAETIKTKVQATLTYFNLQDRAGRPVGALSGGERQVLALAGVLVLGPRVLVLDEPTSTLDYSDRLRMRDLLQEQVEEGVSVLMVTQRMDEVLWAHRVAALHGGRVAFDGSPREFFLDGHSERLGLGFPPAWALAREALGRDGVLTEAELIAAVREVLGERRTAV